MVGMSWIIQSQVWKKIARLRNISISSERKKKYHIHMHIILKLKPIVCNSLCALKISINPETFKCSDDKTSNSMEGLLIFISIKSYLVVCLCTYYLENISMCIF